MIAKMGIITVQSERIRFESADLCVRIYEEQDDLVLPILKMMLPPRYSCVNVSDPHFINTWDTALRVATLLSNFTILASKPASKPESKPVSEAQVEAEAEVEVKAVVKTESDTTVGHMSSAGGMNVQSLPKLDLKLEFMMQLTVDLRRDSFDVMYNKPHKSAFMIRLLHAADMIDYVVGLNTKSSLDSGSKSH